MKFLSNLNLGFWYASIPVIGLIGTFIRFNLSISADMRAGWDIQLFNFFIIIMLGLLVLFVFAISRFPRIMSIPAIIFVSLMWLVVATSIAEVISGDMDFWIHISPNYTYLMVVVVFVMSLIIYIRQFRLASRVSAKSVQ